VDQNWSVALLGPAAALALWFMASEQEISPSLLPRHGYSPDSPHFSYRGRIRSGFSW